MERMNRAEHREKTVKTALLQFVFPFSLKPESGASLVKELGKRGGYTPFYLNRTELEDAFYGEGFQVSHKKLERYYLHFTGSVLFPRDHNPKAFQRMSKAEGEIYILETPFFSMPFKVLSVDVIVCPFDLGFLTVRIQINQTESYSRVLEFADRFRVLEDVSAMDNAAFVLCGDERFQQIEQFLFRKVAPGVMPYLDTSDLDRAYFETLPFFVDERMFVQAVYAFADGETITTEDQYRALHLDGVNEWGEPFTSSGNPDFITGYCDEHIYGRWSPETFFGLNEHTFCCLTNGSETRVRAIARQMYGEFYYGVLLNMFHKIVLLKLSNEYSQVRLERDKEPVEGLIRSITTFSANYYFLELASQLEGKELFFQLRQMFGIHDLYLEVKQTLLDLYTYQDRENAKSSNYLLLLLTMYTVVGGIYGMNQVIEDLKGRIDWSKMLEYSIFEYIALFTTLTGLVVGIGLSFTLVVKWIRDGIRKRER